MTPNCVLADCYSFPSVGGLPDLSRLDASWFDVGSGVGDQSGVPVDPGHNAVASNGIRITPQVFTSSFPGKPYDAFCLFRSSNFSFRREDQTPLVGALWEPSWLDAFLPNAGGRKTG
jgi:hypothetical protein